MASIEIGPETEGANHWRYRVRVKDQGRTLECDVTLSWADYDLWSHGRVPPHRVVEKTFEFLLSRQPASNILAKFDCSVVRRYFPDVDRELPRML